MIKEKYLRAVEAADFLSMGISEFLALVKAKRMPEPHFMGLGSKWKQSELENWRYENGR